MNDNEVRETDALGVAFREECVIDEGDLCAQSVDLTQWFDTGLTATGSFDLGIVAATSFGSLLDALPIPILMMDSTYRVVFLNQACGKFSVNYERIHGVPFTTLVPRPRNAEKALWLLRKVFSTRRPQVADGIIEIEARKIWGRLHFSSIRIGRERFVLLLIEDLTSERTQLLLNKRDEGHVRRAHQGLEQLVAKLTSELDFARKKVDLEERLHKKTREVLKLEQQKCETLSQHARIGVGFVSADDRFEYVNNHFRELFDLEADDLPDLAEWVRRLNLPCTDEELTLRERLAKLSPGDAPELPALTFTWHGENGTEKLINIKAIPLSEASLLVTCEEWIAPSATHGPA